MLAPLWACQFYRAAPDCANANGNRERRGRGPLLPTDDTELAGIPRYFPILALRFEARTSRKGSVGSQLSLGGSSSLCSDRARSLVIFPPSTVAMQTSSSAVAKRATSGVWSSFARWARPRVQAKIDAMGLVLVTLPAW